jgi:hypothetical protein
MAAIGISLRRDRLSSRGSRGERRGDDSAKYLDSPVDHFDVVFIANVAATRVASRIDLIP